MRYSPEDIRQGMQLKQQAQETPSNFGLLDGETQRPDGQGFGKSRMAGEGGARALALINDPNELQSTNDWMARFGMSNEGQQFNQARMIQAGQLPPEEV